MHSPSKPLWTLPIAHPADPCLDLTAADCAERVAVYTRTRDPADLGRLPRVAGVRTTLWLLRPLTSSERATVLGEPSDERRRALAFRLSVHERRDDCDVSPEGLPVGGVERRAQVVTVEGTTTALAPDAWLDEAQALGGGQLLSELGQLVIDRAQVHPRALAPFRLPWGLAPAR